MLEAIPSEPTKGTQTEYGQINDTKNSYRRTLSGGLQSPRAEVPKKEVLQRINSKKAAMSYQLGHQLSIKWSTGAGPRIGCVSDYPMELRVQALELVNLSPRFPPTPLSCRKPATSAVTPPSASPSGSRTWYSCCECDRSIDCFSGIFCWNAILSLRLLRIVCTFFLFFLHDRITGSLDWYNWLLADDLFFVLYWGICSKTKH